jgi:4'-phosphopantetheinyl transferase
MTELFLEIHDITLPSLNEALHTDTFLSLMGDHEKSRYHGFHRKNRQEEYLLSRIFLRHVLSGTTGASLKNLNFTYSPEGKPKLECRDSLFVNWTHSQSRFILGITNASELGVDLEYLKPLGDVDALVARFFTAQETGLFFKLPDSQKLSAFFLMWTLKESALKAFAGSIASNLNDLRISPGTPFSVLHSTGGTHFHGFEREPESHFAFSFTRHLHELPRLRWTRYETTLKRGRPRFTSRQVPAPANIRLVE